jgi:hypothetical protein
LDPKWRASGNAIAAAIATNWAPATVRDPDSLRTATRRTAIDDLPPAVIGRRYDPRGTSRSTWG